MEYIEVRGQEWWRLRLERQTRASWPGKAASCRVLGREVTWLEPFWPKYMRMGRRGQDQPQGGSFLIYPPTFLQINDFFPKAEQTTKGGLCNPFIVQTYYFQRGRSMRKQYLLNSCWLNSDELSNGFTTMAWNCSRPSREPYTQSQLVWEWSQTSSRNIFVVFVKNKITRATTYLVHPVCQALWSGCSLKLRFYRYHFAMKRPSPGG